LAVRGVLQDEFVERDLPVPGVANECEREMGIKPCPSEGLDHFRGGGVRMKRLRVEPGGDAAFFQLPIQPPLPLAQNKRLEGGGDAGPGVFVDMDKDETVSLGDQHVRARWTAGARQKLTTTTRLRGAGP